MNCRCAVKVGAAVAVAALAGCSQIDTGHVGVKKMFGEITSQRVLREGLWFYNPFGGEIVEYDCRNQVVKKTLQQYTKDVQQATVKVSVTYSLDPEKVIDLERTTGQDYYAKLIDPQIDGAVKDVFGRVEAEHAIPEREKARADIQTFLSSKLAKFGIVVSIVELTDVEFQPDFEKAVEDKQIAKQNAIRAQNETVRIKEEAQQKVIAAKAEAESMEVRAAALEKNRSLVMYEAVMKWNGVLPQYLLGTAPLPIFDVKPEAAKTR